MLDNPYMSLGKRIKERLTAVGSNQSKLARAVKSPRSTVSDWVTGKTEDITGQKLIMAARHLQCSSDWLVTGKGDVVDEKPLKRTTNTSLKNHQNDITPVILFDSPKDLPKGEFVLIDKIDVKAAAGDGCINGDYPTEEAPIAFRADWVKKSKATTTNLKIITVSGDSMLPTLFNGDDTLVDLGQNEIINGNVYAFIVDGAVLIKRLYRAGDKVIAHSDNDNDPKYKYDIEYSNSSDIRIMGRIVNRSGSGNL